MAGKRSYRELFEKSPNATLILEGDRFVDCNPAAVRMLDFPDKSSLLAHYSGSSQGGLSAHPAELSPKFQADGRDSFELANERIATTFERGSHTFEWTHLRADGGTFLVEVELTVLDHETRTLHVVWRDIEERKRLEEELRRAQRLETVGRLAGGIAHDFNNLLVVILGNVELLETDIEEEKTARDQLTEIRFAADRAAGLTRQLLAFSRGLPSHARPTDIGELVTKLGTLLRRLVGEHIELVVKREPRPLTVVADPSQLEQIAVNLAVNARDAMVDGGRLEITASHVASDVAQQMGPLAAGEYASLRVTDSGAGMTAEQIEQAFEPFFTTKPLGKGTGLGLATVRAIAEQHGGSASLSSTPGEGTTVDVLLPLSTLPAEDEPEPQPTLDRADSEATILLVEDEDTIRGLLMSRLRQSGYRVIGARDGRDAIERAEALEGPIDLLVTDVVMPRLSGPELVRRLSRKQPGLEVLYMSGYSEEADTDAIPAERLLSKPFSPRVLESEVRRILDESGRASD